MYIPSTTVPLSAHCLHMRMRIFCSCKNYTEMAADPEKESVGEACESLSHRAEIFRSKLIEDFQILDCVTEEGREKAPVYNSSDATSIVYYTRSCRNLVQIEVY